MVFSMLGLEGHVRRIEFCSESANSSTFTIRLQLASPPGQDLLDVGAVTILTGHGGDHD